jgi:MFS transporter, PAT family, beta-lactamase induction signal transducer AmpG
MVDAALGTAKARLSNVPDGYCHTRQPIQNCMTAKLHPSRAPVWLMGLTNSVFGMYGGIIAISVPQLLSARHVPESKIAAMSAMMMSPAFWTFLVSPVLDVRFSRRTYCLLTAGAASALLVLAVLNLNDLLLVEGLLVSGFFCANLFQSALGGWLSSITAAAEQSRLSVWVTIGNIAGGGAMAVATGELVLTLSPSMASLLLGAAIVLPTAVFPWMPAPGPNRRLAGESFRQFFGEVLTLLKQRAVLTAIVLFVAPAATFSLTNFLSGLGSDFHASSRFVGLVGGAGVLVAGIVGCGIFPLIDRRLSLRSLYLAIGVMGSLFTFALIAAPRLPVTFAVAMIVENIFQALAFTASTAITFDTIGRDNPLAATIYCLLTSAFNVPVTYMLFVDGAGYAQHGLAGSYAADAGVSLAACVLLAAMLIWQRGARGMLATVSAAADVSSNASHEARDTREW